LENIQSLMLMKTNWKYLTLLILLLASLDLPAQLETNRARSQIRKATRPTKRGIFPTPRWPTAKPWNSNQKTKRPISTCDALYRQGRYQEAGQEYIQAARIAESPIEQAQAFHNLGNTFMAQENYKQSVDAYKEALRRNPRDNDTRYNLAYALKKLQQQQQNNQDKENQDQQDQENQDQQQDQDQQDQKQDQQDQKDQQDSEQNEDEQKQDQPQDQQENGDDQQQGDQQPQQAQLQEMSKEEIEKLLENLQYEEDQLLKEISKRKVKHKANPEKDW
jgi:Ca-activated chloride channel family protein